MNDTTSPETSAQPDHDVTQGQLEDFQALITSLMRCCQERAQYQSERFGLPDAELRCLMLFEGERYLTPKSIALRMNVAKSRVTRIVGGLRKRGLLKNTNDPEDSRVTLLSLTPEGKNLLLQISAFMNDVYSDVLAQFSLQQRQALINSLGSLKLSMETVKDKMV